MFIGFILHANNNIINTSKFTVTVYVAQIAVFFSQSLEIDP